jgi:hypothetical protein
VAVLGPDRMIASDPDPLPGLIHDRRPRDLRVQQCIDGGLLGGQRTGRWLGTEVQIDQVAAGVVEGN